MSEAEELPPPSSPGLPAWLLALSAFLLLAYPWFAPFLQGRFVTGWPLVLVYILTAWLTLILISVVVRGRE